MNLIHGKLVLSAQERDAVLDALGGMLLETLRKEPLPPEIVWDACQALADSVGEQHIPLLAQLGISEDMACIYLQEAKALLQRDALRKRVEKELVGLPSGECRETEGLHIRETRMPLGVLLHIAAGNQYGLAFYSIIEGLLTGNINIVKVPGGDDGLTAMILLELLRIEPRLAEYIYLFDYSSQDETAMQTLVDSADAVVVWGGDAAVSALRRMAKPNTKLIEWGHKCSFAYITTDGMRDELLIALAAHIVRTNQLLCSSCQVIYLNTDSMDEIYVFCKRFLPILEQCRRESGEELPLAIRAQTGLLTYTQTLQACRKPCRVFTGAQHALLACEDDALEASIPYGNCAVKRLPRAKILETLKPRKGHLQTAGLLCAEAERAALTQTLWRAGVLRVAQGADMSQLIEGEAHDGEYALRRYVRVVSAFGTEPH
ncbi:MAG: acyl-CoA reductase [Clostridiales bacterium]|nr:acyl-CoA reductase [Clostridiales bacterium]